MTSPVSVTPDFRLPAFAPSPMLGLVPRFHTWSPPRLAAAASTRTRSFAADVVTTTTKDCCAVPDLKRQRVERSVNSRCGILPGAQAAPPTQRDRGCWACASAALEPRFATAARRSDSMPRRWPRFIGVATTASGTDC